MQLLGSICKQYISDVLLCLHRFSRRLLSLRLISHFLITAWTETATSVKQAATVKIHVTKKLASKLVCVCLQTSHTFYDLEIERGWMQKILSWNFVFLCSDLLWRQVLLHALHRCPMNLYVCPVWPGVVQSSEWSCAFVGAWSKYRAVTNDSSISGANEIKLENAYLNAIKYFKNDTLRMLYK